MIEEESDETTEAMEEISLNKVNRSIFTNRSISGTVKYSISGTTLPAYGIYLTRGSNTSYTSKTGNFSLGTSKDIFGLCWIWANYENSACKLSNFLNLTASTLIRVGWPSSLTNVTIYASSDYSTAKMAICNELCTRYSDELERHDSIPQARIWTTEIGNGTSSAPCLQYLAGNSLPDLVLTNCDSYNTTMIRVLHHEYTHYLHNIYTNDKDDFGIM